MNDRRMRSDGSTSDSSKTKYDDPPYSRLFVVCNKGVTEDELRPAFEEFGKVEEVWIVKDKPTGEAKGIAYVKFSKTSEAAAAMEALDGKRVGKGPRPIKILIAHSRDQNSKKDMGEDEKPLRLFVMVPKSMSDADVRDHFSKFGNLDYSSVVKDKTTKESKGYGYIKYYSMLDAARAFEQCDRIYKPVFADPKPSKTAETYEPNDRYHGPSSSCFSVAREEFRELRAGSNGVPCSRLLVVAPPTVNQDQLWKLFDLLPGLDYCDNRTDYSKSPRDQRMVVVAVYTSVSAATYAKEKLHGFEYPPGHRLIVKYDALLPGEKFRKPEWESAIAPSSMDSVAAAQSLISRLTSSNPGGNQVLPGRTTDLAQIAESFIQAATVLQSAGISTKGPITSLPGSSDGRVATPTMTETYDPSYCSARLPPPQPLASVDAEVAERLFIVCQPPRPALFALKDVFGRFGNLIDVYMLSGKNYGYAKFAVRESASRAIKALDDHEVCGSRLKVMLAEPLNAKEGGRKRAKTEETSKTKEETEDQNIME
uniref:Development regulated RNA-binding protein n=1 Tax=Artemia sinica TaxID=112780 RepID=A0A1D8MB84_9CRUS|nr:development regulated RNA-binding protein [Artemia sinica]